MQSSDREILIDIQGQLVKINTRLDRLESRMDKLEQRVDKLETRFDDLTGYIGNWFTILAIFVAVIGVITPLIFSRQNRDQTDARPVNVNVYQGENQSSKSEK